MTFRLFLLALASVGSLVALAEDNDTTATTIDLKEYMPTISGTVRARYEYEFQNGDQRYQVRNARLWVEGKIAQPIDYKIEADFCEKGSFKVLSAWARLAITPDFKVQGGEFRMPFAVEPFRSPHSYIFTNRSFIAKQVGNVRGVGAKATWTPHATPWTLEGAMFNVSEITDHTQWGHAMAWAARASYKIGPFTLVGSFESIVPDSIRINMTDACVAYKSGRWTAEAEYLYKHYTNDRFRACHAYSAFASYAIPVRVGVFNQWSFQGRWDGMTDHSDGTRNDEGNLYLSDEARNRLTLGTTLSYIHGKTHADVRFNYENYFYHHHYRGAQGERDKISIELVVHF